MPGAVYCQTVFALCGADVLHPPMHFPPAVPEQRICGRIKEYEHDPTVGAKRLRRGGLGLKGIPGSTHP